MKKLLFLFTGLLAGIFVACHQDFDITTATPIGPIPAANVQASLYGRVMDPYNNPLSGVTVIVNGQTYTTNNQGLFFVYNKTLDQNGTYVQVTSPAYFPAARFAYPHAGSSTYLEINMLSKYTQSNFSTTTDAEVLVNGGASILIPAGSLVTDSGMPYNGTYGVAASWLDPSASETFNVMPGDLRAQNADGEARVLKTFGMIGVELSSPSGQALQIAPGKKATIRLPIPSSIQASAPSGIALWHFQESNGYWVEEGQANREGNFYVGEVSHFSFWNCDVPADYILLNGCLGNAAGQPLADVRITLTSSQFGTGYGYTDEQGLFGGMVPANETLILKVWNNCNSVAFETTIGPFSTNTTLSKINVDLGNQQPVNISGDLLDCNGLPLTTGLVFVFDHDTLFSILPTDENGHFQGIFYMCYTLNTLNLTTYDVVNQLQSTSLSINIAGNTANAGTIPVCSALDEYVIINVDTVSRTYYQNTTYTNQGFYASNTFDSNYVQLTFSNYSASTNQATINYLGGLHNIGNLYQSYGCAYCTDPNCGCDPGDTGALMFTHYPQFIGDYATGTASGSVFVSTGLQPYTLSFRLKKTQ